MSVNRRVRWEERRKDCNFKWVLREELIEDGAWTGIWKCRELPCVLSHGQRRLAGTETLRCSSGSGKSEWWKASVCMCRFVFGVPCSPFWELYLCMMMGRHWDFKQNYNLDTVPEFSEIHSLEIANKILSVKDIIRCCQTSAGLQQQSSCLSPPKWCVPPWPEVQILFCFVFFPAKAQVFMWKKCFIVCC